VAALVLSIGLVYLGLLKAGTIGDSDVWWHLRTGDLIRKTGSVPLVDPFSWTAGGESWQPNAWMSDVMFSWFREVGGLITMSIYRSLGVLFIGLLLWWMLRRVGAGAWPTVAAVFLGELSMMPFITERPQVMGFVLFGIMMLILHSALQRSWIALTGLGVLLALWANLHGSFIMGVGVVGLSAFGLVLAERTWRGPAVAVAVAVVAPLLNPYGVDVYRQALSIPGVSTFIEEWRSFNLTDGRDQLIALFALVAILGMYRGGNWKKWPRSLPMLALVLLTLRAIRSAPFLLMWGTPFFADALASLSVPRLRSWAAPRTHPLSFGLLVAGVVMAGSVIGNPSQAGQVDLERTPIAEIDALPDGCRLLNEYEFGGALIDRRWPEVAVSQDGRNDLYGVERIELQESLFVAGDVAEIESMGITCVLARNDRSLADALRRADGWESASEGTLATAFVLIEP
jgi:hypothetical protein